MQTAADLDVALAEFQARGRAGVRRGPDPDSGWSAGACDKFGLRPAETEMAGMNVPRRASIIDVRQTHQ